MKKRTKYVITLALALSTSLAIAQRPGGPNGGPNKPPQNNQAPGDQPPGEGKKRPKPPLLEALDTDGDGIISAAEIANAPQSLKKLDKNGDGQLTPDELRPPRREGGPNGPGDNNNGDAPKKRPRPDAQPQGQDKNPPPDAPKGPRDQGGPAKDGPKDGPPGDGDRPKRPAPPLMAVLDLDGDGTLSADEIAKASESLKKLDKNGDGQLTPDEYRPAPPEGRGPRDADKGPRKDGDKGPRDGADKPPGADNAPPAGDTKRRPTVE